MVKGEVSEATLGGRSRAGRLVSSIFVTTPVGTVLLTLATIGALWLLAATVRVPTLVSADAEVRSDGSLMAIVPVAGTSDDDFPGSVYVISDGTRTAAGLLDVITGSADTRIVTVKPAAPVSAEMDYMIEVESGSEPLLDRVLRSISRREPES